MNSRPPSLWRRTGEVLRWRGLLGSSPAGRSQHPPPNSLLARLSNLCHRYCRASPRAYAKEKNRNKDYTRDCGCPRPSSLTSRKWPRSAKSRATKRNSASSAVTCSPSPTRLRTGRLRSDFVRERRRRARLRRHLDRAPRRGRSLRQFRRSQWRGRGIQSSVNTAVNEYARERGVSVTSARSAR